MGDIYFLCNFRFLLSRQKNPLNNIQDPRKIWKPVICQKDITVTKMRCNHVHILERTLRFRYICLISRDFSLIYKLPKCKFEMLFLM